MSGPHSAEFVDAGSIRLPAPIPQPQLRPTPPPKSAPRFSPLEDWRRSREVSRPVRIVWRFYETTYVRVSGVLREQEMRGYHTIEGEDPLSSDVAAKSGSGKHSAAFQSTLQQTPAPARTPPFARPDPTLHPQEVAGRGAESS
jgi:hypothetical protein